MHWNIYGRPCIILFYACDVLTFFVLENVGVSWVNDEARMTFHLTITET